MSEKTKDTISVRVTLDRIVKDYFDEREEISLSGITNKLLKMYMKDNSIIGGKQDE